MLAAQIGGNLRPVALGIAEHAFRPFSVSEPKMVEMFAAKTEPYRGEPEIPILEAEPHALVKADAPLEHGAPHETTRLADVFLEMPQHRVFARIVAVPLLAEHVDVRINPASLRVCTAPIEAALQGARQKPIVGVEEIDRLDVSQAASTCSIPVLRAALRPPLWRRI